MKIGIDARLAGIEHAGIGRYVEELLRRVIKNKNHTWVIFLHHKNQLDWLLESETVKLVYAPIRHYTLTEQLKMPGIFAAQNLDLLHVPHFNIPLFYSGTLVITIHDLLWHEQKGSHVTTLSPLMYSLKYVAYKWLVSVAVKRALRILVPANTVKKTIASHFPSLSKRKIIVTKEGVDRKWFTDPKKLSQTPTPRVPVLFYTGSLYPHKNVLFVSKALKKLPGFSLYISSSRNVFTQEFLKTIKELGLSKQVKHVGRLSDSELKNWYRKCYALVQPTLSEGFGLTGLEAMAAGSPVLASNIPVFSEIYGSHAVFFNPKDESSFLTAVKSIRQVGVRKQATALLFAATYSWDTMAEQTMQVYDAAVIVSA